MHISIETTEIVMIPKVKVNIDSEIYFVEDIKNMNCNEGIIHNIFDYGHKIIGYANHKFEHNTDILKYI